MEFMSWLVSLGIFSSKELYKRSKINSITRKSEQAQAKIDAWRAKYTDQALEEQYYAECREKYPELSRDQKSNGKVQRSHEYAWQRLRREFPDVKIPLLLESDFVRPMLAKHGKILIQDTKTGIYAIDGGYGEGEAKYKARWEQNHYMQWYAKYLEAHDGPTGMKFFPFNSLVEISKMSGTSRQPMKDYYELDETDPLLFTVGEFDWLENKIQYQSGYWK